MMVSLVLFASREKLHCPASVLLQVLLPPVLLFPIPQGEI